MFQRLLTRQLVTIASPQFRPGVSLFRCKKNKVSLAAQYFHNDFNKFSKAVAPQQPVDLLMQNIRSASDTTDVLYNVQQHHAIMNDMHIMQALQSIFLLQKSQTSTLTNRELVRHDSFQLLCKILQQKIRYLELNDHLNALKVLSFISVPSNDKIMQILLQLVSKRVNDLSLQQIVFLDFMLKDFQSSPLADALKIALPIVFEAGFRLKSDFSDMKQLTELFIYAIRRKLSDKCIDTFVEKINEHRNNLDVETSKLIVRTLCEAKRVEMPYRNLLVQSLDNIVDNIHNFTFLDLNYILVRLTPNLLHKNNNCHNFYHEEFFDSVGNFAVDKKLDVEQVTWVLKSFNKFKHSHKGVIDYVFGVIADNPSCLDNLSIGMLVTLVNSLSVSDYRPDTFKQIEEILVDNLLKFTNKMELPWLRVALDLCTLDCWPHDLFNVILQKEFLSNFMKRGNVEDSVELILLYQAIVTLCPSYQGNLPSESTIKEVLSKIKKLDVVERSPLLPVLSHGLGGPSYVVSPAYTKLGHFIDHALVMRKGGYPVSINNNLSLSDEKHFEHTYVEDIHLPADSHVILVIFLTPKNYTLNTERILGHVRLNMQTLEAMGFNVLSIIQSTWDNLLDGEKIPYLMQALQNKCQPQEVVAASHT